MAWLTPKEGSKYARCREDYFRSLLKTGEIPSYPALNQGKRREVLVRTEDIDARIFAGGPLPTVPALPANGRRAS